MSTNKITWKEPTGDEVDCTVQVCTKHPRENFTRAREATLDDLRKACEAAGYTSGKLAVELAAHMQGIIRNEGESIDDCVRRLTKERDAAIHRAEMAEAALQASEEEAHALKLSEQDGTSRLTQARAAYDQMRAARDAAIARAEKAEGELEGAKKRILTDRGNFERELEGFAEMLGVDDRRDLFSTTGMGRLLAAINSLQVDEANACERAEAAESRLAALAAPVEVEAGEKELTDTFGQGVREGQRTGLDGWRAIYRLGVQHERARHISDLPRATDEELESLFEAGYFDGASPNIDGIRAVADRVRREQCLVTRAVEAQYCLEVTEVEGEGWTVLLRQEVSPAGQEYDSQPAGYVQHSRSNVAPSDVARVLAEMLGEVVR